MNSWKHRLIVLVGCALLLAACNGTGAGTDLGGGTGYGGGAATASHSAAGGSGGGGGGYH